MPQQKPLNIQISIIGNYMQEKPEEQLNSKGDRRGMSHNSQNNLHPRLKGNNHARKGYSITRIIREMLDQPATERWLEVEDKGNESTWRQAIAKRILIEAVKGNARLISELLDRVDGKVMQPIGGENGQPIRTEIVVSTDATKKLLTEIMKGITPHALHHD